jgi:hypothetical protein
MPEDSELWTTLVQSAGNHYERKNEQVMQSQGSEKKPGKDTTKRQASRPNFSEDPLHHPGSWGAPCCE